MLNILVPSNISENIHKPSKKFRASFGWVLAIFRNHRISSEVHGKGLIIFSYLRCNLFLICARVSNLHLITWNLHSFSANQNRVLFSSVWLMSILRRSCDGNLHLITMWWRSVFFPVWCLSCIFYLTTVDCSTFDCMFWLRQEFRKLITCTNRIIIITFILDIVTFLLLL